MIEILTVLLLYCGSTSGDCREQMVKCAKKNRSFIRESTAIKCIDTYESDRRKKK